MAAAPSAFGLILFSFLTALPWNIGGQRGRAGLAGSGEPGLTVGIGCRLRCPGKPTDWNSASTKAEFLEGWSCLLGLKQVSSSPRGRLPLPAAPPIPSLPQLVRGGQNISAVRPLGLL